jgi:hypothetical protein
MPRYHFNIVDSVSQPDPEGSDLVDLAQVRREALRLSGEVLREMHDEKRRFSARWTAFARVKANPQSTW